MNSKQLAAVSEDLRKIGTTAMAAALVGIFISDNHRLLTSCALLIGALTWLYGIYLTKET